jgi:hypothetical protein
MSIDFKVNIFTDGNIITTDSNGVIVDDLSGKLSKLPYIVKESSKTYKEQSTEHPDYILTPDRVLFIIKKFEENEDNKEYSNEENAIIVNYKQISSFTKAMTSLSSF